MTVESVGRRRLCYLLAESEDNQDYFVVCMESLRTNDCDMYCKSEDHLDGWDI